MATPLYAPGNVSYSLVPEKTATVTETAKPAAQPTVDSKPVSKSDDSAGTSTRAAKAKTTNMPPQKFPLPNVLHKYPSYTYNIGLGALKPDDVNNPDATYMKSDHQIEWICKEASMYPNNRVIKYDFFIDNLEMTTNTGLSGGHNSNITNIKFTVTEPYSMGQFFVALQYSAVKQNFPLWSGASFVLSVSFFGNTEGGKFEPVMNSSRKIAIHIVQIDMAVSEKGSVYNVVAQPFDQIAHSDNHAKLKTDVSITGTTVQEALQTGPKSLQTVLNNKLAKLKDEHKVVNAPDKILILFPVDTSSKATDKAGAITESAILDKLKVKEKEVTTSDGIGKIKILEQSAESSNALGKAKMTFGADADSKKNDEPIADHATVYDPNGQVYHRGNAMPTHTQNDFRFRQGSDIINAINQTIMQSSYVENMHELIDPKTGNIAWWRVDVKTYVSSSTINPNTGAFPFILVYEVVPYDANASAIAPAGVRTPTAETKKQVVKEYNYIYTGKNVDIIKFDIKIHTTFSIPMPADVGHNTADIKKSSDSGQAHETHYKSNPTIAGKEPDKNQLFHRQVNYDATDTQSDKKGGGGEESSATRVAKSFMEALTVGHDMVNLEFDIVGDPYFLLQSGLGNYTGISSQYPNLLHDGSMNYQNGEVYITVNFKNPVDLNQSSGMFDTTPVTTAVDHFSGLYKVNKVTSSFKTGQFTQTLNVTRWNLQESTKAEVSQPLDKFGTALGQGTVDVLKSIGNGITSELNDLFGSDVVKSLSDLVGEVDTAVNPLKEMVLTDIVNPIGSMFSDAVSTAVGAANAVIEPVSQAASAVGGAVVSSANEIGNVAGKIIK
jgi:hypothetical protein